MKISTSKTTDSVAIELVKVVAAYLPESSFFGRLGEDEFIVFSPVVDSVELCRLCDSIITAVRLAFANDEFPVTVSLGAITRDNTQNFHNLYRTADIALYQSKKNGRNDYTVLDS